MFAQGEESEPDHNEAMSKPPTPDALTVLQRLKKVAEVLALQKTVLSLSSYMVSAVETSTTLRLTSLVRGGLQTTAEATELMRIWRVSKNQDCEALMGESIEAFRAARPLVLSLFADEVAKQGVTEDQCKPLFELCKMYKDEPSLKDPVVGDTLNKSLIAFITWAKQALSLKDAVSSAQSMDTPSPSISRSVLMFYTSIKSTRGAKKHLGHDTETQIFFDIITQFVVSIEAAAIEIVKIGGKVEFGITGASLVAAMKAAKVVEGCSPEPGKIWHSGWPQEEVPHT